MFLRFVADALASAFDWSGSGFQKRADLSARMSARLDRARGLGYGWDTPAEEARAILPLLPTKGAVLFDVGAHHGEWTAAALKARPTMAKLVHAFEPSPENCNWITTKLLASEPELFRSVSLWPVAVSGKTGYATLYTDRPGSGLASLIQRDLDFLSIKHEPALQIETVTLDEHASRHGIDRIDFLKMDIEGHELAALQGAEQLLSRGAIRALAFEFGGCNIDSRTFFRDFWKLLTPLNFSFLRIVPGGKLLPIREYSEHLERFATSNYVAVRE